MALPKVSCKSPQGVVDLRSSQPGLEVKGVFTKQSKTLWVPKCSQGLAQPGPSFFLLSASSGERQAWVTLQLSSRDFAKDWVWPLLKVALEGTAVKVP